MNENFLLYYSNDVGVWSDPKALPNNANLITFLAYGQGDGAWTLEIEVSPYYNGQIDSNTYTFSFTNIEGNKSQTFQTGCKSFVARIKHSTGIVYASLVGQV